jgi:Flp pilus assembly protein TadD
VAVLPIVLAGCADSATEIRARYGDTSWTPGELTSTPYDRGSLHFTAGRYGLAVKHFEIAIAQDSDSVEALNGLAASFDRLQRFDL